MPNKNHSPRILYGWLAFALLICAIPSASTLWQTNAAQIEIYGPSGSGQFGENIIALPNGNFVVVDSRYDEAGMVDVGAVYLYNGSTLAVISTLKGSRPGEQVGAGGITVLTNGNFVVSSPYWSNGNEYAAGAATWCNATSGCNGTVSIANSLVGRKVYDGVSAVVLPFITPATTVIPLSNGNYVVAKPGTDNPDTNVRDTGAVTWCNGAGGGNWIGDFC